MFETNSSCFCRVRVEILRALANRVSNTMLVAYCIPNGTRPRLSVGPASGYPGIVLLVVFFALFIYSVLGRRNTLNYVDAIRRYGHMLEDHFLDKAYDRAKMFFSGVWLKGFYIFWVLEFKFYTLLIGELERTFLVLRESVALKRAGQGAPPAPPVNPDALPEFEPEDDVIPGPENNPKADEGRGLKRVASVTDDNPSKKR